MKEAKYLVQKDILFLGSSRAYRGFDTRIFNDHNFSSFNLGTSNQTPLQTFLVLDRYLHHHRPKCIVFEVNPDIFSNDGVESAVDMVANIHPDWDLLEMSLIINHIKVYNTLIFNILLKILDFKNGCPLNSNPNEKYISGGFVEIISDTHNKQANTNHYTCNLSIKQMKAFSKIMAKLKKLNIPVLLVQSPVRKLTYASCKLNAAFSKEMRKYSRYIDFNTYDQFDELVDFTDDQHLSQRGVIKFNQMLIEELNRFNIQ